MKFRVMRQHFLGASGNKKKMKTLIEKIKQEIVYAKERMLDFDESNQKSNSDVELGVARGLNMALDIIKDNVDFIEAEAEEYITPIVDNNFTQDPHHSLGEDLKTANEELVFDDRQDKKLEEDLGYGLEDEPSGHVKDLEVHKEELRRGREENL